MREINDHPSLAEILELLRSKARDQTQAQDGADVDADQEHLARCHECAKVAEQYRGLMGKLEQYGKAGQSGQRSDCPPAAIWAEIAAGIASRDEADAGLEHAGRCGACAKLLKEAIEIIGIGMSDDTLPLPLARELESTGTDWQRKLAQQMQARSGGTQVISFTPRRPKWTWAAVAAAIIVVAGVAVYTRFGQPSPEKLLAEAYTKQRTIELRIQGASYGPIRVERASGGSALNKPSQLLDAELTIKRRLEQQPESPDSLRERAEVDLLNWDYQSAIETLGHALRLQPQSFLITLDLGTAHFERAEKTNSPADYEASLNYLGDAIRLQPTNPAALFNRAIVYERLYLYGRAIEDWEQLLKVEKDAGWRKEAEKRLQELREREQKRSQRKSPEQLTLAQFTSDVKSGQAAAIEEYLEVAERQILPKIVAANSEDENYRAATVLAEALRSAHGDEFLKDFLAGANQANFQRATKLLGKSSAANHEGRSDEAYSAATQAAEIFHRSGNTAGYVAAGFEQAYALQFQSKAVQCESLATKLVGTAFARSYAWLNIQLRLEEAMCSNMNREVGPAKNITKQAAELAKEHNYQSLYLRGLTVLATLEAEAGNETNSWSAIQEGLGLYWKADLPTLRAFALYSRLNETAEQIGHPNVQFAAEFEALQFQNPSRLMEASELARMGNAAFRLGDLIGAETQFRHAQEIFASSPKTEAMRWRELEVQLWLARLHAIRGTNTSGDEAALVASLPEVGHLSNRYLESQYYYILADLKMRSGDPAIAKQLLLRAIQVADDGSRSLPTWRERMTWMDQHRNAYIALARLLFRSGSPEAALNVWEQFRTGSGPPFSEARLIKSEGSEYDTDVSFETRIITYAFTDDGLMIWIRHVGEIHSAYLTVSPQNVRQAAENLIAECSRPDSEMSNLKADAQYLHKWLIQPISQWLPSAGHIIVEPDGVLGVMPFEALMDPSGAYLGNGYAITMAPSVRANDRLHDPITIKISDLALIAAAPAATDGSMKPAAGAITEALRISERFRNPMLLVGNEVQVSRVGRELARSRVFHFAGHAGLSRTGAAILLADGILGSSQARALDDQKLSNLKLAVFSACGTAKGSELSDSDSLVTAFLQAGAQNVVASRWNVDSMTTADFVDTFYGAVLSGASVADAIQTAAAAFRTMPERAHPYYWAAFAAFGRA